MATRLKNILAFVNVASGATVQATHLLNLDGVDVIPDKAIPDAGDFTVTATSTLVEVTNNGAADASVNVLVEYWRSPNRVFGDPSDNNFDQLTPAPFAPEYAAGGAGAFVYIRATTAGTPSIPTGVSTPYETDTIDTQVGTNYQISSIAPVGVEVLSAGFYQIAWSATFATNAVGGRHFELVLGAAGASPTVVQDDGQQSSDPGGGGFPMALSGVAIISFVANDVISLSGLQNSGGNLDVTFSSITMTKLA